MRLIPRICQVFILVAILVLIAACGSDDSEQVNLQLAEEKAELLYRSALTEVLERSEETGEYVYREEDISLVEQALEVNPKHLPAMEVMAWIYSTYPDYAGDDSFSERALEYGLEVFKASGNKDVHMYQILGAAMYKNGHLILGDQFFDGAIEKADSAELAQHFRESKKTIRDLYADSN